MPSLNSGNFCLGKGRKKHVRASFKSLGITAQGLIFMKQVKFFLNEKDMPRQWYNLAADLSGPLPLSDFKEGSWQSGAPAAIFSKELLDQEASIKRWVNIPEEIFDAFLRWRPTPLRRAIYLERYLKTPAKIYYKDESISPAGSHKANTAIAQAWYNKRSGAKKLTTETGAGQWGTALAFAAHIFGLDCKVFMVRLTFEQSSLRKILLNLWGADCVASPSRETKVGRSILRRTPDTSGSIGIAISEALEEAMTDKSGKTRYAFGSVLNHVLLHQTIIGLEAKKQLKKAGIRNPDVVVGCVGGGSNLAGIAFPFVLDKINGAKIDIIPVESKACPKMTKGKFEYDYADTAGIMPRLPMYTLGAQFIPPDIQAGGLRYHGTAPLVSQCIANGLMRPHAVDQLKSYEAAVLWARTEGFIIAPETSYAVASVIEEAKKAKKEAKEKIILFCLSGHGLLDLSGYDKYLRGEAE